MALSNQIVRDAPEGCFLRTGGVASLNQLVLTAPGTGNALTIAGWFRATTLPTGGATVDVVRLSPSNTSRHQIAISLVESGGDVFWQWEYSDNTAAVTTVQTGTTPVIAGDWYYVVGCKNDTFTSRLFVNGVDDTAILFAGVANTFNEPRRYYLGRDGRGINGDFDGDISYVAMWDIAISEESVKATYNGGWRDIDLRVDTPCYKESDRLQQWWRLGQGTGTSGISVGDELVSNWVPTGVTLPDRINVTEDNTQIPGLGPDGTSAGFSPGNGLGTSAPVSLGLGAQLSISFWVKPADLLTTDQTILFIGPAGPSETNVVDVSIYNEAATPGMRVDYRDSAGITIQRVKFDDLLDLDEWQHILLVLNSNVSPAVTCYKNGIVAAGATEASGGGTSIDSARFVDVGGSTNGVNTTTDFDGQIGHVGMWGTLLNTVEAQTLFGQGYCIDLRFNGEAYQSGEFLRHYYKLGEDQFTKGRDYLNTQTSAFLAPLTIETGTVDCRGDFPGTLGEVPPPAIPGSGKSVQLDGSTEWFANNTQNLIGINANWSISFWAKWNGASGSETLVNIQQNVGNNNRITVEHTGGSLVLNVYGTFGTQNWSAQYQGVLENLDWNHVVITFENFGPVVKATVYVNSSLHEPIILFPGAEAMSDSARNLLYGNGIQIGASPFGGNVGHLGIWSAVLPRLAIKEIFLGNFAIDLSTNGTDYTDAANLEHYYRPGFADEGFFDEGNGAPIDFVNSVGIDDSNIVPDAPPVTLPWERSVLLDGATQHYALLTDANWEMGNDWAIAFWVRAPLPHPKSGSRLVDLTPSGSAHSSIFFSASGGSFFSYATTDSSANSLWSGQWNSDVTLLNDGEWHHMVNTWDGEAINMYIDGKLTGATMISQDSRPGVMADNLRQLFYGSWSGGTGLWDGLLGHLALFNSSLSPNIVQAIFCGGHELDLRFDEGAYTASSNLAHYYRPGWTIGTDDQSGRIDENHPDSGFSKRHLVDSVINDLAIVEDAPVVVKPTIVESARSTEFTTTTDDFLLAEDPKTLGGFDNVFSWSTWVKRTANGITSEFPRPFHMETNPPTAFSVNKSMQVDPGPFANTESYQNRVLSFVRCVNQWSHSCWFKPDNIANGSEFLLGGFFRPSGQLHNRWFTQINQNSSQGAGYGGNTIVVTLYDNAANLFKRYSWFGIQTAQAWHHWGHTWDGTNLRGYMNGVEVAPTTLVVDNPGTMGESQGRWLTAYQNDLPDATNPFRSWVRVSHHALWSGVLGAADMAEIFNRALSIDLRYDSGGYTSSSDLEHYYRPNDVVNDNGIGTNDLGPSLSPKPFTTTAIRGDFALGLNPPLGSGDEVFDVPTNTTPANSVSVLFDEFNRFTISMRDDFGNLFKQYIGPAEPIDEWHHYTWTWDGATLRVYRDSVEITNTTVIKFVDEAGSRTDTPATFRFGALGSQRWNGKTFSPAVWKSVLSAAEVTELFNAKALTGYRDNFGNYISADELVHLWDMRNNIDRFEDRVGDQDLDDSTVTPDDTDLPV